MKKLLFSISLISSTFFALSQNVGINSTGALPDNSAGLDIDYTNKGLLVPRVSLTSTTDVVTIPAPATSLLVYNTNAAMTGGAVGYWYYDGAAWVQALGPQGPAGLAGTNGTNGIDGLNCWDANGNGVQDASEDINLDGNWDALDCAGPAGTNGTNGTNGTDGLVSLTNNTVEAPGINCPDGGIKVETGLDTDLSGILEAGEVTATTYVCNGAAGTAGTNGTNGTNGVTYMNGITLGASYTVNTLAWANVTGMSFSFTAQTTSALVVFSASGYGYTNSMAYVQFRIRNGGTTLGTTQTKIQSYDDVNGTITPWSCTYTRYITGLTIGTSYTLSVQGQRDGILGTYDAVINPTLDGHHMSLSVVQ
ncbi:MAG: hypothetical protein HYU68_12755 [Bacteroidetes bacterium]|nr:hypothetical protein [Bacteroidota bacterium]